MKALQLCLLAALFAQGYGADWDVLYPESLQTVQGSCLFIPCTFVFPSDVSIPNGITAIWFKEVNSHRIVVYHSATNEAADTYKGRAELLGNLDDKNCTLLLRNIKTEDAGKYQFRYEISEVHRWLDMKGVMVSVTSEVERPEVTFPADMVEGTPVTLYCSTRYVCPFDNMALEWKGYAQERSLTLGGVQLDTAVAVSQLNLTTTFLWQDNLKKLSCGLTVGTHQAKKEITLNIRHSPKGTEVLLNPSRQNIKEGDSMSLTCDVKSSNPEVTVYKWYKNGKVFYNKQLLSFPSVTRTDYGEYSCEVQNAMGVGLSPVIPLNIFSAKLLVTPSSEIQEGEEVTVTCDVPSGASEEIMYKWYKNNIWIKEGSARSLVFQKILSSDAGYYYCTIQNDMGGDTSQPIILNVLYPPRTPEMTSFLETQEGKVAIIHCMVDSIPVSELTLHRNDKLIATTSSHGAPTQRLSISSSRNSLKLEIKDVTLDDEGKYVCRATNAYGTSETSKNFAVEAARVLVAPSTELHEGDMVTLACITARKIQEEPRYIWYKDAKWLKESSENYLVFPAIGRGDAGSYYCRAQDREGSNVSPSRMLHVLYPPRKPMMTSFLETQDGQQATIQCTVDSEPSSEIALFRGEELVASTNPHIASSQKRLVSSSYNSLKLEIRDIVFKDEGTYTCVANNTYGNATSSMEFTAETARIEITPSTEIHEGETVNLTCTVSTDSKAGTNYTWYKNGESFSESSSASLVFQHILSTDAGSYHCKVSASEGSRDSASVSLNVWYPPRNLLMKSFLETEEGKLAIIYCSVDSNPLSTMTLSKNNVSEAVTSVHGAESSHRFTLSTSRNALKLEIKNVRLEDGGRYVCSATNTYGTSSDSLHFHVLTARVLVTPSTEVKEGEKVTLSCDLTRNTKGGIHYSWYKNSKWLEDNVESSLVFQEISSHDTGYYHCNAQDNEGSSTSPSVSLRVFYGPREPMMTSFLEMRGGRRGIIQCTVDSDPSSEIALYKEDEQIVSTRSKNVPNQRLLVSSSYNSLKLEIRDVVLEDEGMYVCLARNTYGNANSSVDFTAESARILVTPSALIPEGDRVNLTCVISSEAQGMLNYTWYKNGNIFMEGSKAKRTLLFLSIDSGDAGSYHCCVQNVDGSKSSSPVTLSVLYPPRNQQLKSFLDTEDEKSAIFLCTIESNPPSQLTMYKEGEVVASTSIFAVPSQRLSISHIQNTLKLDVRNVMLDDEGNYTCLAKNALGNSSAFIHFTAKSARVVMNPATSLHEGDTVTLTCIAMRSTYPVTSYTWYKNTKWFQQGSTSSLVFQKVTSSDAGSYSCKAQSTNGDRSSPPVTLRVFYAPNTPLLTSFVEPQGRQMGIITCTVDSDPPSEISLYRNDKLLVSNSFPSSDNEQLKMSLSHNSLKVEIKNIRLEEQGIYSCTAKNHYGTANTSLHFFVPDAEILVAPSTEIHEGNNVNLTCMVTSKMQGKVKYIWYKNSRWLKEDPAGKLLLESVDNTDTGSYHCMVKDTKGNHTSSIISLNVLYAPRNLRMTSFVETQGRQLGIILCTVDSEPSSKLTLLKNNVTVASTSSHTAWSQRFRMSSSYNSLQLEIKETRPEDSAEYVCTAKNMLGIKTSSLFFSAYTIREGQTYKIIAWIVIVASCALITFTVFVGVKYWQKKMWFWKLNPDKNPIEMTSKDELQALEPKADSLDCSEVLETHAILSDL
ncbi:sialoadhesin isoform X2 [Microcaecilia unicolor]|nr:sialoadhesin isoform X2 [Microcaecilia unicolor]XP_030046839.1 sialoadhesin isoform X2 [Microcaecilia unicolor]